MCPKGRYGDSKGLKADGVDSKDADTGKECASCPRGRYLDLKGSPAVSSCKVCMQGYYLDTTNDMDSSFNTGVFNCKKCPRGRFGAAEALEAAGGFLGSSGVPTKDCTGCSIGYYLEEEAKTVFDDCIPCDAGRFQPVIGANDKDDCKPCARGYYSEQVAQDAADDCAECAIGMYADEFGNSLQEDCKPCPRGTWSNVTAIISKLDCRFCPVGADGTDTGRGSADDCTECPMGKYLTNVGSDEASDCVLCPAGRYGPSKGLRALLGEAGCRQCPLGMYLSQSGKDQCDECPVGFVQGDLEAASCTACDAGKYQSTPKGTTSDCPSEMTGAVPAMFAQLGDFKLMMRDLQRNVLLVRVVFLNPCQDNFGSKECEVCPVGFEQPMPTAVSCGMCDSGKYAKNEESRSCDLCNMGTYQDEKGQQRCKLCPAGQSQPLFGQTSFQLGPVQSSAVGTLTVGSDIIFPIETVANVYPRMPLFTPSAARLVDSSETATEWHTVRKVLTSNITSALGASDGAGTEVRIFSYAKLAHPGVTRMMIGKEMIEISSLLKSSTDRRDIGGIVTVQKRNADGSLESPQTHFPGTIVHAGIVLNKKPLALENEVDGFSEEVDIQFPDSAWECLPCALGKYTSCEGFPVCLDCPPGQTTYEVGSTKCVTKTVDTAQPRIQDDKVIRKNDSTLCLSWEFPEDPAYLSYIVHARDLPAGTSLEQPLIRCHDLPSSESCSTQGECAWDEDERKCIYRECPPKLDPLTGEPYFPRKYRYCRREYWFSGECAANYLDAKDEYCDSAKPTYEHFDYISLEHSTDRAFRPEDTDVIYLETDDIFAEPDHNVGVAYSNTHCISVLGNADGGNGTIPLHKEVVYARVAGHIADARGTFSSTTNQWTTTLDCDDGAFLNASSAMVRDWNCQTCPRGGDCSNAFEFTSGRRWEDVRPKFGFFRLDPVDIDYDNYIYFYECFRRDSCLGGRQEKYAGNPRTARDLLVSMDFNRTRRPDRYCTQPKFDSCVPGDPSCVLVPTECLTCGQRCSRPPQDDPTKQCHRPDGSVEPFDEVIFDGRPYYFTPGSNEKFEYATAHNGKFVEGWLRRRERTKAKLKGVIYPLSFYPQIPSTYDVENNPARIEVDETQPDCPNRILDGGCCVEDPEKRLLQPHLFGAPRGYIDGDGNLVEYNSLTREELLGHCDFDWLCDVDLAMVSDQEICNFELGHANNCSKSRTGRCRLCRSCKLGFFPKGLSKCMACPPLWLNVVLVFMATTAAMTMLVVFLRTALESITNEASRHAHVHLAAPMQKIMLNHMQLVSLASGFPLKWPDEITTLFDVFGIMSNAGSMLFNPACNRERSESGKETSTFFIKQLGLLLLPFMAAVGCSIFWFFHAVDRKFCYKARMRKRHIQRLRKQKKKRHDLLKAQKELDHLHGMEMLRAHIHSHKKKQKKEKRKKKKKNEGQAKSKGLLDEKLSKDVKESLQDDGSKNVEENVGKQTTRTRRRTVAVMEAAHSAASMDEHHDVTSWSQLDKLAAAVKHSHNIRFKDDHDHDDVMSGMVEEVEQNLTAEHLAVLEKSKKKFRRRSKALKKMEKKMRKFETNIKKHRPRWIDDDSIMHLVHGDKKTRKIIEAAKRDLAIEKERMPKMDTNVENGKAALAETKTGREDLRKSLHNGLQNRQAFAGIKTEGNLSLAEIEKHKILEQEKEDEENISTCDKWIATMVTLLYLLYPTVTRSTFQLMACQYIGANPYLQMDLDIPCYQEEHWPWVIYLCIPAFILYVYGLPGMSALILYLNRKRLDAQKPRFRYATLFTGYRKERYYWESVVALRKASTIGAAVFLTKAGAESQALTGQLVTFFCLMLHLEFRPFMKVTDEHNALHYAEMWALATAFFTFWSGLMFFVVESKMDGDRVVLLFFTITLITANSVYMITAMRWFLILKLMDLQDDLQIQASKGASYEELAFMHKVVRYMKLFIPEWRVVYGLWQRSAWKRVSKKAVTISKIARIMSMDSGTSAIAPSKVHPRVQVLGAKKAESSAEPSVDILSKGKAQSSSSNVESKVELEGGTLEAIVSTDRVEVSKQHLIELQQLRDRHDDLLKQHAALGRRHTLLSQTNKSLKSKIGTLSIQALSSSGKNSRQSNTGKGPRGPVAKKKKKMKKIAAGSTRSYMSATKSSRVSKALKGDSKDGNAESPQNPSQKKKERDEKTQDNVAANDAEEAGSPDTEEQYLGNNEKFKQAKSRAVSKVSVIRSFRKAQMVAEAKRLEMAQKQKAANQAAVARRATADAKMKAEYAEKAAENARRQNQLAKEAEEGVNQAAIRTAEISNAGQAWTADEIHEALNALMQTEKSERSKNIAKAVKALFGLLGYNTQGMKKWGTMVSVVKDETLIRRLRKFNPETLTLALARKAKQSIAAITEEECAANSALRTVVNFTKESTSMLEDGAISASITQDDEGPAAASVAPADMPS
eukprot:g3949.t1